MRIFDPSRRSTRALTFRANGPRARFDHHRGDGPDRMPADDPDRAVYYASWSDDLVTAFESCFVKVFGDHDAVVLGDRLLAMPTVTRVMRLLDLRDHGAMRAGTVAAVAKCEHNLSQAWSRHFYEHESIYMLIDGLMYRNAHNDGPAMMFFERAQDALVCTDGDVARLDASHLELLIETTMLKYGLAYGPDATRTQAR
jgi:hypothetical protein